MADFVKALAAAGFAGDFEAGLGAREVAATDNSIYQIRPAAIAYPRQAADALAIMQAARACGQPIIARGGNTGTNGQSLGAGVVVDFARHMRAITAQGPDWVAVEPGVVLDQLNAALAPQGRFFPPMVSTASRATLGGMVATDASGKGSRLYGKTSDHLLALDVVLADGTPWRAEPMPRAEAEAIARQDSLIGRVHAEALRIADTQGAAISATFPRMNRGLTGYNLQRLYDPQADRFSLTHLLAGSEGTLALTTGIRLATAPRPRLRRLAVVRYGDFASGLAHVGRLLAADPLAVEILDDKVIGAGAGDPVWAALGQLLGGDATAGIGAMNFVEFVGDDEAALEAALARLGAVLGEGWPGLVDWALVREPATIALLWGLREKAVGLLARLGGGRQGMPFVEDSAVPPERLPDYVAGFRAILDAHGLAYGMFGHADVGCLHVRPFLDMKDPAQAALIRPISDAVAQLAKAHGGLLWGEHGRGFRGEYSPLFFGPELYPAVEAMKRAFDPDNLLNPGKLAAPAGQPLDRIDAVPLRGAADATIPVSRAAEIERALACNGNGACFSWKAADVMCPSYKITRDRAQSPKGRAALLRGWARGQEPELEAALAASLDSCLGCKACASQCPVRVDVPAMASRFWQRHYAQAPRPLAHHLLRWLEPLLALGRAAPGLANGLLRWGGRGLARLGLVDLPAFAPQRLAAPAPTPARLAAVPAGERWRHLVLVADSFTASFEGALAATAARALAVLGYQLWVVPARANGKHLHALGYRAAFAALARRRQGELARLAASGVRLFALDPPTALLHAHEYREGGEGPALGGLEAILAADIAAGRLGAPRAGQGPAYTLLSHCTEQALASGAAGEWQAVLAHFGCAAAPAAVGCCGMAGLFGHRADQQALSRALFAENWAPHLAAGPVLATGFSCRCQAQRLAGVAPRHPVAALAEALGA